ncbi:nuclear transport factor 2 family protein [Novosphingobium resinovorum]
MTTTRFDLEAEVRDLAARRDIADAAARYMRGLDRLEPDLQRSAFHDDAVVDCGLMKGSADEFVAFAQGFLADMNATHHLLGQSRIAVDGDGATGEWYFQAWHSVSSEDGACATCSSRAATSTLMPAAMANGASSTGCW